MKITRRHVLATAAGVAAAGVVGAGTTAWRWWDRSPAAGFKCLSDDEYAFIQAMAEAWMPRGGEPALSGADAELGRFMDDTVEAMNPLNQKLLKVLMQILDDWTLPVYWSSYKALDLQARQAVLHGWLHHDHHLIRSATQGLLILMGVGWTTHPEVSPFFRQSMNCWYGR